MKLKKLALAIALIAGAGTAAADVGHQTVSWTDWSSGTGGAMNFGSTSVGVTFSGSDLGLSESYNYFANYPSTYATVVNSPAIPDLIQFNNPGQYTVTFSQAVLNPVMALVSVGQTSLPVEYQFSSPFVILSQGGNQWGGSNASFTYSGSTLAGAEGNGVIQFLGTYSSISWNTPQAEFWHGMTIGAVAAVPEPETYAMLMAGLGLMGGIARRRKTKQVA